MKLTGVKNMLEVFAGAAITLLLVLIVFVFNSTAQKIAKPTHNEAVATLIYSTIQKKAEKVVFVSETDSDVNLTIGGRNLTQVNTANFIKAFPMYRYQIISERAVNDFMTRFESRDDYECWFDLIQYLQTVLMDVQVFRTEHSDGEYFIIGLYQGRLVGVRMY
jgi:hypothetical protein